jgi:hypothetical protein
VGGGMIQGKGVGGEYGRNIMYSCMKMEKWDLLKLLQEWGEGIKNDGGGEFNYNIVRTFISATM